MPETGRSHELNLALLAIRELYLRLFLADTGSVATLLAGLLRTCAGLITAGRTGLRRFLLTGARCTAAFLASLWLFWLTIPLRITEMVVSLNEVIDREVVLAIVKPGAAPDDLLELNHRIHRPHEYDVADVTRIHAGRELLRGSQNGRDSLFVVLKVAQPLLAQRAIMRSHSLAVVGVGALLDLVDQVAHGQRMGLRGTKDDGFFFLVDLVHEDLDALLLALLDLDDLVEILLFVAFSGLDLAFHHGVVRGEYIVIQRGSDLLQAEGCKETIVDAVFERIDEHRLAEVGIGVGVVLSLRRSSQTQLHGGGEVFEDTAPVAFIICTASVALVDDDEVEEVRRVLAKVRGIALTTHKGLEDREENAAVLRHLALLLDLVGSDANERIFGEG